MGVTIELAPIKPYETPHARLRKAANNSKVRHILGIHLATAKYNTDMTANNVPIDMPRFLLRYILLGTK